MSRRHSGVSAGLERRVKSSETYLGTDQTEHSFAAPHD